MEKNNNSRLSFPQRYWWLLCIVVCFASPVAWHYIRRGFRGNQSKQMIQIENAKSSDSFTNAPPDSLHH